MFQLVGYSALNFNEQYKIVTDYEYTGRFKQTIHICLERPCAIVRFDNLYNVTKKKKASIYIDFCDKTKYYKFVSDQPQWNMERRAVNLIVRRLIGDDCFEW